MDLEIIFECNNGALKIAILALILAIFQIVGAESHGKPINRYNLVSRHNIEWNLTNGQVPLGNGEFCFNSDGTGLQTFGGNTMSHWGWHSFPLPGGWKASQVPKTGTFQQGRSTGPDIFPPGTEAIRSWMFDNPDIMNLGRFQFCHANGTALSLAEVTDVRRTVDLWSGTETSSFEVMNQRVEVQTCVHPTLDAVVVKVRSPLISSGKLRVSLDFPYPTLDTRDGWVGDFSRSAKNETLMKKEGRTQATFLRKVDSTTYHAKISISAGGEIADVSPASKPPRFVISETGNRTLGFVCAFSPKPISRELPSVDESFEATAAHWKHFWMTGGAIDLKGSTDPRWFELERRIVLSQYELAAQSSGSYPSAEDGLMGIDPWRGQFHMEMVWWHLAHYALWGRLPMAEKALGCYQKFMPAARALAKQLGHKGLQWPKSVGPEGRSAPWTGNQVLLWKEPHPIFFAELEYRQHPTHATLVKWEKIVFGTATYMADFPTLDPKTGIYSLIPDMPPSEQGITKNTVFDLAYWRWGLKMALEWRKRLGLKPDKHWEEVLNHLAPLPVQDGVYTDTYDWPDYYQTKNSSHPDPTGIFGMLPPSDGADLAIAHRTVLKVWKTWDWNNCWGWDFPWMAMAAARTGEPAIAIDALLKDSPRNQYDARGVNSGGPCPYLPGNGGLLYAVAMMAAGWDGCPSIPAPGFPHDGAWKVRYEGLFKAP